MSRTRVFFVGTNAPFAEVQEHEERPLMLAVPTEQFDCEEGESSSPIPMPGRIVTSPMPRLSRAGILRHRRHEEPIEWRPSSASGDDVPPEDGGEYVQLPGLIVDSSASTADISVAFGDNSGSSKTARGLCTNCELRHTCTFARAEGGVWRCEEYR